MNEVIHGEEKLAAILSHPAIAKLRTSLGARRALEAEVEADVRKAAVALIFRAGADGSPELLFIKRAEYAGDPWSGQIAFPGGREESGDASLQETATRETREETGIDLAREAFRHSAEVVQQIAAGITDPELRSGFLAEPAVRQVLSESGSPGVQL